MRNTGILIILVGIFLVINAGSFRDVVLGKATFNFINPKSSATSSSASKSSTSSSSTTTNTGISGAAGTGRGGSSFSGGASGSF